MHDFIVEINLCSSLVLNHTTTLDAVLGGILAASAAPGADLNTISRLGGIIDRDAHGVPMASEIILNEDQRGRVVQAVSTKFNRKIQQKVDLSGLAIHRKNAFGNKLSTARTIHSHVVRFFGRGNVEEVRRILTGVQSIGGKRNAGYGQIASFEVSPTEFESGVPGIVYRGRLIRPVPRDLVGYYGVNSFTTRSGRYENPYSPIFYPEYPPVEIARPESDFLVYREL